MLPSLSPPLSSSSSSPLQLPAPIAADSSLPPPGAGADFARVERKARMTALTPLVFRSAFVDGDSMALEVVNEASLAIAKLIAKNLGPAFIASNGRTHSRSVLLGQVHARSSVLCLGGSLVGIPEYRDLILGHLARMGHVFPHVEYVGDAAEAGVLRLVGKAKVETRS